MIPDPPDRGSRTPLNEKPPSGAVFFARSIVLMLAMTLFPGVVHAAADASGASLSDDGETAVPILVDERPAGHLDWRACDFASRPDWPRIRCAVLTVPQDYRDPAQRQAARKQPGDTRLVQLPLIYVHPYSPRRRSVPLLVAGGGGPGYPLGITDEHGHFIGDDSLWNTWYGSTLDAGRALILIDNRGVGSARPRLDCDGIEQAELDSLGTVGSTALRISQRDAIAACRDRLQAAGVELANFQSLNAARDLEVLRQLRELPEWNLYGASYGSRIALVYEALFPEATRSIVLDGAYPPGIASYEKAPRLDFLTLRRAFAHCESDPDCEARTGGLALMDALEPYLARLDQQPLSLTVTHPLTDEPLPVTVDAERLLSALWSLSYDADAHAGIPRIVNSILKGNTDLLATLMREQVADAIATDSLDEAAYASYHCHDELPFSDFAVAEAELARYPLQHHMNRGYFETERAACAEWAIPSAPASINTPFRIDTPMLILSGALDPVTPPAWGEALAGWAETAWHRVWPDVGHGVLAVSACADWVVGEFLAHPDRNPFTLECLN